MNASGTPALLIALVAVALFSGFIVYIFRAASKLTGNRPSTKSVLRDFGPAVLHYQEGRYPEAAQHLPAAINGFERQGDILGVLAATNLLGQTFEKLGEHQNAAQAYKSVMSVAFQQQYEASLSLAHRRFCFCQLQLGNPTEAEAALLALSTEYRRNGNSERALGTLLTLALTLREQGYLENADAAYRNALDLSEQLHYQPGRAMTLNDQALFLRSMGRQMDALAAAQEAAQIASAGTDRVRQSHYLGTTADILRQLARIPEAEEQGRRAMELAKTAGSQKFIAAAGLICSLIAWTRGQRDEARILLQQASDALDDKGRDRKFVHGVVTASFSQQSGDLSGALAILEELEHTFPGKKDLVEAAFFNVKARTLGKAGRHEEASSALRESSILTERLKAPSYRAEFALTAGVVAHHRGVDGDALLYLDQAMEFFRAAPHVINIAETQKYRGAALAALGRTTESAAAREEARRLYLACGNDISAQEVDQLS